MKIKLIKLSLIFILLSSLFICCYQFCDEVTQTVGNETIVWMATLSEVRSKPPCINDQYEIAERVCTDGKWAEEPNCIFIQNDPLPCPDNMSHMQSAKDDICFLLLHSVPFDAKCPYSNLYPLIDMQTLIAVLTKEFVWFPAKGQTEYGIGEYYLTEPSTNYGRVLTNLNPSYEKPLIDQLCLVYNYEDGFKAVACNASYTKICAYNYLNNKRICEEKYKGETCTQIDFDTKSNCICVQKSDTKGKIDKNDYCENLVELHHPYQNKILINNLKSPLCRIGLEKSEFYGYLWSASKIKLNYTYWRWSTNFNYSNMSFVIDNNGWNTWAETLVDCALCIKPVNFIEASLTLKFEIIDYNFLVEIRNHNNLKLLNSADETSKACCFFRSNTRIKYRIDEIFDTDWQDDVITFKFKPYEIGPGYYWCEGFMYPNIELIKSNEFFLYDRDKYGNEYVAKLIIHYLKDEDLLDQKIYRTKYEARIDQILKVYLPGANLRTFATLKVDPDNSELHILAHITIPNLNSLNDPNAEYAEVFKALNEDYYGIKLTLLELSCTNFCYEEVTLIQNKSLSWPTTLLNETALSRELCLQQDGFPVERSCNEDFIYGAHWDVIEGCHENAVKSNITDKLHDLLENNVTLETSLQNLTVLSELFKEFTKIDIYLIQRLLHKMSKNSSITLHIQNVTEILSNVMQTSRNILANSQVILEATDGILKNYDKILVNFKLAEYIPYAIIETENIILLIINLNQSDVCGMAWIEHDGNRNIEILYSTSDTSSVLQNEHLKTAIFVNQKLVNQIKNTQNSQIIITLFAEDSLFNEEVHISTAGNTFGVLIPHFYENFVAPISLVFKNIISPLKCAHWEFMSQYGVNSKSHWMENSGDINYDEENSIVGCEFWHVTHFGLLILGRHTTEAQDLFLLKIITYVSCALSLIGLSIIFLTAVLFKDWRLNSSNQVLLNFSFSLTLKIILFFWANIINDKQVSNNYCIAIGVSLHYFVIAEFCWMLVISILQYKRLITVFGVPSKNIIFKICLVGWILPLLPVIILLFVSPNNYVQNNVGFCYPSGLGFYLTVLTPAVIILSSNITVFLLILSNYFKANSSRSNKSRYEIIYWFRTMVMLFCVLGLPWVLSFLSFMKGGIFFLYLFNFLTTLQGCILFAFFILLNKTTRKLYVKFFQNSFFTYW